MALWWLVAFYSATPTRCRQNGKRHTRDTHAAPCCSDQLSERAIWTGEMTHMRFQHISMGVRSDDVRFCEELWLERRWGTMAGLTEPSFYTARYAVFALRMCTRRCRRSFSTSAAFTGP